nr:hypothetical protein [Micromonospora sp. DSM 115978]
MTGQRPIPGLADTLMYAHCVQVWITHSPVGGLCACGWPSCRRREAAEQVIVAAGVDPATVTATAVEPGRWYERPTPARGSAVDPVAAYPIPRGDRRRPPSNAGSRW